MQNISGTDKQYANNAGVNSTPVTVALGPRTVAPAAGKKPTARGKGKKSGRN